MLKFTNLIFSELENKIENIWLHLKALIDKKMGETNQNYSTTFEEQMKLQILQNTKKDSPVRSLMCKLLLSYFSGLFYIKVNIDL